jgi:hypothetical protein
LALALALLIGVHGVAAAVRFVMYKNCDAMHRVYPGGVAKRGAKNVGGKTRYKPFYSDALYQANTKSDRDKDGIACER